MPGESRFNLDTVAFVTVVCLLVIGAIWVLARVGGGDSQPPTGPSTLAMTSGSPEPRPSTAPTETGKPSVRGQVHLSAPEADTWVEVRKGGPEGAVLFSGMVKKGHTRVFVADVLWLRLRNPSDVRLRVEGRKIAPSDSVDPVDYIVKNGKLERQG